MFARLGNLQSVLVKKTLFSHCNLFAHCWCHHHHLAKPGDLRPTEGTARVTKQMSMHLILAPKHFAHIFQKCCPEEVKRKLKLQTIELTLEEEKDIPLKIGSIVIVLIAVARKRHQKYTCHFIKLFLCLAKTFQGLHLCCVG